MTARGGISSDGLVTAAGLGIASLIVFFAATSLAAFSLIGARGAPLVLDAGAIGALLMALWLGVSGIEILRRRHFVVAILGPAVLALVNLLYVLGSGESQGLAGVVLMLVPVVLVGNLRSAFR